jgi:hypothetical protein
MLGAPGKAAPWLVLGADLFVSVFRRFTLRISYP